MGPRGGTQTRPFPTHPTPMAPLVRSRQMGQSCLPPMARLRHLPAAGGRIALDGCFRTAPQPSETGPAEL